MTNADNSNMMVLKIIRVDPERSAIQSWNADKST